MSLYDKYETLIKVHGSLMSIAFFILLPIGILLAIFGKSLGKKWFLMHWIFNAILAGSCITVAFIIIIYAHFTYDYTIPHFSFNFHTTFGLIIVIFFYLQIGAGIYIHYYDRTKDFGKIVLIYHNIIGKIIFISGIINIYFGLMYYNLLFDNPVNIPIIIYITLISFFTLLIIILYIRKFLI